MKHIKFPINTYYLTIDMDQDHEICIEFNKMRRDAFLSVIDSNEFLIIDNDGAVVEYEGIEFEDIDDILDELVEDGIIKAREV